MPASASGKNSKILPRLWGVNTPWTLLMKTKASPQQAADLDRLLSVYREPVLAFYLAQGMAASDAEDLTQNLLMDFFLVRSSHKHAQAVKGRFRNYLLSAARNALLDWKKHRNAIRRGGRKEHCSLENLQALSARWEPVHGLTSEEEYERQWALATWRSALELFCARNEGQQVKALQMIYLDRERLSQKQAARQLGISVAAFNSRLYTARRGLLACIHEIVKTTVESEDELTEELGRLQLLLKKFGM